jgi:DNA repair protein RecN (Recombination protein N)
MAFLFDLHVQHAHESLLRRETHRKYLDRFAGIEEEALRFNRLFLELAERRKTLEAFLSSERDRETRIELLNYAMEEIDRAAPKSGESRELEGEASRLASFEKLAAQANGAAGVLFEDEASLLGLARRARLSLENAAAIDTGAAAMLKRMEDIYYEAEDLAGELRSYRDDLRYDPQRLEAVEERLALLYKLKKKYAPDAPAGTEDDAVLAYRVQAEAEAAALSRAEENRDKLKGEIAVLEKEVGALASALSAKRSAASIRLGERITEILRSLGMSHARFSVGLSSKGRSQAGLVIGPWGTDDVEFLISANAGEPVKELARIASGGELSRVMLAIKTALLGTDDAERDASAETLVFDEIDTGIGGEVALAVGDYLVKIAQFKQIFCVTHLASIAVRADNHLKVEKRSVPGGKPGGGERTVTSVSALRPKERREEIARMLAGDSAGAAALAHADELLLKYGKPARKEKLRS